MREQGKSHVLLHRDRQIPVEAPGIAADGGPYTLRGSTANFNVHYEDALGDVGPTLADGVLATCEGEYVQLQAWFGGITPPGLPFEIYVVTGDFGAYHATCAATEFHCAAADGTNVDLVRMLVVAEEVEVFEAALSSAWDCGASNGEGLSRVLATEQYPNALNGFASAASWLDSPDRPDFVSQNDPTDRSYVSTGCAVLFLNYLHSQLNLSWAAIVQQAGATLAETYQNLTGRSDAFAAFSALLEASFPIHTPSGLTNDNPFPLPAVTSLPAAQLAPKPPIFDSGMSPTA